jgi:hypothetical protein
MLQCLKQVLCVHVVLVKANAPWLTRAVSRYCWRNKHLNMLPCESREPPL